MSLVFDEPTHTYWLDKTRIPGVNEILKTVGLTKNWEGIDPFYANRGKAVHLAIQYYLQGGLDEKSLDPQIIPYFEGFKKYQSKYPLGVTQCEFKGLSADNSFAGTIDLVTEKEIIDWKCSKSHDKVAELQGEGYKCIAMANFKQLLPFKVVQFPGDGTYEVFDYGPSVSLWDSVMKLFRWKKGKNA